MLTSKQGEKMKRMGRGFSGLGARRVNSDFFTDWEYLEWEREKLLRTQELLHLESRRILE